MGMRMAGLGVAKLPWRAGLEKGHVRQIGTT
jgi:hypothetical protein